MQTLSCHLRLPAAACALGAALLWIHSASAAGPQGEGASDGEEARLAARLLADPQGDGRWRVGVELVPDPGWHVYWRNPGEIGLAPRLAWSLPGGEVGPPAWPVPRSFFDADADLLSFGYEQPVLLAAPAHTGAPGPTRLSVEVDALVCAHQCIPGTFSLETTLDPDASSDPAVRTRFDAAEDRLPRPLAEREVEVTLERRADAPDGQPRATLLVRPCAGRAEACEVGSAGGGGPAFFPYESDEVEWKASAARPVRTGVFAVDLEARRFEPSRPGALPRLSGVIPLRDVSGRERSVEVALALGRDATGATPPAALWLRAAGLGLLGGLLLNLMPCVLPVLALKLHSLAGLARGSHREHRRHAAAYVAGIELSMLALAAVVLALRAAGTAVGWGFQLQEPVFVVAVASLLVLFALNLFGVFEIQVDTSSLARLGSNAPGAARSFFDGLLAVALATPCSAPFLGTAVGLAFASPGPVIVSIFAAIGAGLAAPFVLAAFFPAWTRALPRSGAWMGDLRGVLGFALLLTVVWLLWILGRAAGSDAVASTLLLLVVLAVVAWLLGLLQHRGRNLPASAVAALLVGVAVAGIGVVDLEPESAGAKAAPVPGTRPFTADALRATLREGRPVFVYFTADWCVTCKVNEKRVLTDARVAAELERLDYAVLRGDWTRRDEAIRSALSALGKAGVPVYALFDPKAPGRPTLLPELLTVDGFLEALRRTAGPAQAES